MRLIGSSSTRQRREIIGERSSLIWTFFSLRPCWSPTRKKRLSQVSEIAGPRCMWVRSFCLFSSLPDTDLRSPPQTQPLWMLNLCEASSKRTWRDKPHYKNIFPSLIWFPKSIVVVWVVPRRWLRPHSRSRKKRNGVDGLLRSIKNLPQGQIYHCEIIVFYFKLLQTCFMQTVSKFFHIHE